MRSLIAVLAVLSITCTHCEIIPNGSNYPEQTVKDPIVAQEAIYHVSIRFQGNQYGVATIIAPQFVVTSCTVIKKRSIYDAAIVAGLSVSNPTGHVYHAKDTECHPEFQLSQSALAAGVQRNVHNIGLIRVDSDFTKPPVSMPVIPMVESSYPPPIGALPQVQSFDTLNLPTGAYLEVLSKETCKYENRNVGGLNYGEICAVGDKNGDEPVNLCDVDEGAPMILGSTLIAVSSWVQGCNFNESVPSVFTEISRNRYWIDSAMEQMFERERREEMTWIGRLFAPESPDDRKCKIDAYSAEEISQRNCDALCRDRKAKRGNCDRLVCHCQEETGERTYKEVMRTTEDKL